MRAQLLAFAAAIALITCTADPVPTRIDAPEVAVTPDSPHLSQPEADVNPTEVRSKTLPPLDQEAPTRFQTATFALG